MSHHSRRTVYVGNLPFQTAEYELDNFFSQVGNVVEVSIKYDRNTGRPRGFAFCKFENELDAQRAIAFFDGEDFKGRSIRVNWARSR